MNLIVSVDENWGIGKDGQLLAHVSADLRRFKELTLGHVVVMGRRTLYTLPKQQPLSGRQNIILTTHRDFDCPGASVVHTLAELFSLLCTWKEEEIFVIGGESVYRQLLPYCRYAYITRFQTIFDADCFFPALTEESGWKLQSESNPMTQERLSFTYCLYENRNDKTYR